MALNTIKEAVFTSPYSESLSSESEVEERRKQRLVWDDGTKPEAEGSSSNAVKTTFMWENEPDPSPKETSLCQLYRANQNYTFASNVIPPFQNYFYNNITLRVFPVVYRPLAGPATKRLGSVRREIPAGSI